jgi:hypothetical protein
LGQWGELFENRIERRADFEEHESTLIDTDEDKRKVFCEKSPAKFTVLIPLILSI